MKPNLSAKVSFVRIDAVDVKLPGYNQRVSNSVFKVTRIIDIVDSKGSKIVVKDAILNASILRQIKYFQKD